jgi:hypothetical protein
MERQVVKGVAPISKYHRVAAYPKGKLFGKVVSLALCAHPFLWGKSFKAPESVLRDLRGRLSNQSAFANPFSPLDHNQTRESSLMKYPEFF